LRVLVPVGVGHGGRQEARDAQGTQRHAGPFGNGVGGCEEMSHNAVASWGRGKLQDPAPWFDCTYYFQFFLRGPNCKGLTSSRSHPCFGSEPNPPSRRSLRARSTARATPPPGSRSLRVAPTRPSRSVSGSMIERSFGPHFPGSIFLKRFWPEISAIFFPPVHPRILTEGLNTRNFLNCVAKVVFLHQQEMPVANSTGRCHSLLRSLVWVRQTREPTRLGLFGERWACNQRKHGKSLFG